MEYLSLDQRNFVWWGEVFLGTFHFEAVIPQFKPHTHLIDEITP